MSGGKDEQQPHNANAEQQANEDEAAEEVEQRSTFSGTS
jgi:hypothetical protein